MFLPFSFSILEGGGVCGRDLKEVKGKGQRKKTSGSKGSLQLGTKPFANRIGIIDDLSSL